MTDKIDTSPEAIAALLDGVTPGPWVAIVAGQGDDFNEVVVFDPSFESVADAEGADARFIAAARQLVPALASERDALSARVAALEAEAEQRGRDAERERTIVALREEADLTPCDEDAKVVADCADLIEHDFSYEDLDNAKEAAAVRARAAKGDE